MQSSFCESHKELIRMAKIHPRHDATYTVNAAPRDLTQRNLPRMLFLKYYPLQRLQKGYDMLVLGSYNVLAQPKREPPTFPAQEVIPGF